MQFTKKDILDMASLSADEINLILDTADGMKEISTRPIKKVPTLRGKTVILFFYEPSTRTRTSFDIAAKRLSADTHSISATTSSIVKGETLIDTARNLEAMKPDVIVIRHYEVALRLRRLTGPVSRSSTPAMALANTPRRHCSTPTPSSASWGAPTTWLWACWEICALVVLSIR